MQTKYSSAASGWNSASELDDAAYYEKRADIELQHARNAANEIVAIVHRNLACRYAALAVEQARTASSVKGNGPLRLVRGNDVD